MVAACKILNIPIYCTTQNAAKLGATVSELIDILPADTKEVDKTAFSMMVPEITTRLSQQAQAFSSAQYPGSSSSPYSPNQPSYPNQQPNTQPCQILLLGIESHICILQTATDLLSLGHRVYVLTDGVSSCNAGERGIALDRLRMEGCVVTTSESVLFEMLGDAKSEGFREVSKLVREWKDQTKSAVGVLCQGLYGGLEEGKDDKGREQREGKGEGPGSLSRL
ncbi:hypothetical protein EPUS_05811 [Endocarpon pusillum Z07020]|uniref:Isochorismatase-like domain-containing protein n=1 Tax=Endocarpon pusillum (strain Z07020 / HMAS-L-300199) TaxID=1263415 RepID=U1GHT3_ENDPU|nr:uncharacterized protein EPUS_05811 [Endocarpon pusillum Z07020]ERF77242.1 hypothetical protein EPUS_05811 [Endocarpon pusillum Z07020]